MILAPTWLGTRPRLYVASILLIGAMVLLIVFGLGRLTSLGDAQQRIAGADWAKADATHAVNALTRANARSVLELFLANDRETVAQTHLLIESNKQIITAKLELLGRMADLPEEQRLMADIRPLRAAYVASFTQVIALLADGKREQATRRMNEETLPTLDKLQRALEAMLALQRKLAEDSASEASRAIVQAGVVMFALCLMGLLASMAVANLVSTAMLKEQRASKKASEDQPSSTSMPS